MRVEKYLLTKGEGIHCFCEIESDAQYLISYRDEFSAVFTDSYVFSDLGYMEHYAKDYVSQLLEDLNLHEKVKMMDFTISNTKFSFG